MNHSDIIGQWEITRNIEDRLNQKKFELKGEATFSDNDTLYHYNETGIMKSESFQSKAHQDYLWVITSEGWKINFIDGSHFHDLELVNQEQHVYHKCVNDIYRGEFLLNLPNDIKVLWNVSGPRKDYVSHTYYKKR